MARKKKEQETPTLFEKPNCERCRLGELYPDARTRCSQARCEYQPGIGKLWKKTAVEKGRLVKGADKGE